jgi:hypothetical protein
MADSVTKLIGPAITLIGAAAPVVQSLTSKTPSMPTFKAPTPVATPTMPTPDDDAAKAAKLREIAKRSSSSGRSSTNLYDKQETLG